MAHFAELDQNNIVLRVIVVNNEDIIDSNGIEQEQKGIDFCVNLLGGIWKQTSYNGTIRKNYAGVGYEYDKDLDAFIPPKPFASWLLDKNNVFGTRQLIKLILENLNIGTRNTYLE